VFFLFLYK